MKNPLLARSERQKKQSKAYWRSKKQEKNVAKRLGGHTVLASGSGKTKGDVRVKGIARIECKSTQQKSFAITRSMVDTIERAAMASDELPAIVVDFLDERGNPTHSLAVVSVNQLELLIHAASSAQPC